MKQHFKVGDLVVIKSEGYPEDNGGPYEVTGISEAGSKRLTAKKNISFIDDDIGYAVSNGQDYFYKQSCLFKYHPPLTKTFTEIMQELKKPVTA